MKKDNKILKVSKKYKIIYNDPLNEFKSYSKKAIKETQQSIMIVWSLKIYWILMLMILNNNCCLFMWLLTLLEKSLNYLKNGV